MFQHSISKLNISWSTSFLQDWLLINFSTNAASAYATWFSPILMWLVNLECIWLSDTGNTSHKSYNWNVKLLTWVEYWCHESILLISAGLPRVPIWRLEKNCCRFLNFLFIYRWRNGCDSVKHNYHYGMTIELILLTDLRITSTLVECRWYIRKVFINNHIVNSCF